MTVEEFLVELEQVAHLYSWRYYGQESKIRASDSTELYCPITAIASQKAGHYCHIGDAGFFGRAHLNLSDDDTEDIVRAADNVSYCDIRLRHKLERAVGLIKRKRLRLRCLSRA